MNRRSTIVSAVALLCFCFSLHQSFAQDGTLDPSFGSSGKVWNPEANFKVKSTNDDPYIGNPRILVLSDGKILHITGTPTGNLLIRYLENGDLDLAFGSGGMINLPATTGLQNIHDAELLPGDQILLAGDVVTGSNRKFALMRLNADGSRDNSFDGDGLVTTTVGTANSVARGLAVQTDGKIVATGEAMEGADGLFVTVRYLPDGTPDPAFDVDGIVYTNPSPVIEYSTAVTIQTDGRILIAGTTWRFVFIGPGGFFNSYVQEA
jgi:uncharacterized delta-60 repeat protein